MLTRMFNPILLIWATLCQMAARADEANSSHWMVNADLTHVGINASASIALAGDKVRAHPLLPGALGLRRRWSAAAGGALFASAGRPPVLAAVCFGLMIATCAGLLVLHLRNRALETSGQELQRMALMLADQAERAFLAVDQVQDSVIERLQTGGVRTAEQFRQAATGKPVYEDLRSQIRVLPQLDAITAIDTDGNLVNFSRYWPVPPVNLADRDYFKALKADPGLMRFFGEPVINRGSGTLTLYLARKVSGPGGEFLGLILGAVQLAYFEKLYEAVSFGPDSSILMRRDDGRLLVRFPPVDARSGPQVNSAEPFQAMRRGAKVSSLEHRISSIDGREKLIAFHLLQHYPLEVGITVTVKSVLSEWRKQAAYLIGATLLLEIVVLGIGVLIARSMESQRRLAEEHAARQMPASVRRSATCPRVCACSTLTIGSW